MTKSHHTPVASEERVVHPQLLPHGALDVTALLPCLGKDGWRSHVRKWLNQLLGVPWLNRLFADAAHERNPFRTILQKLDITTDTDGLAAKIPEHGACIVVANHPNGGSDALTLVGECVERRRDIRVLANSILMGLPGVGKWMIPLDIMGEAGATRRNQMALKAAMKHLSGGGLLVVFPAGTLSHWRADMGRVADPPWSDHIARLARKAAVPVLPVRVFEKNPPWFTLLGALHLHIRSAMVPRLLLSGSGKKLVCRAGAMITPDELVACSEVGQATAVIRHTVQGIPRPESW